MELNLKGYVSAIIVSVIAVLLVISVLVPITSESSKGTAIVYSNDYNTHSMAELGTESVTISKSADSESILVNGHEYVQQAGSSSILQATGIVLAFQATGSGFALLNDLANNHYLPMTSSSVLNMTIEDGVCTYSCDSTSGTVTLAKGYYADPVGEYVVGAPSSGMYVLGDEYFLYSIAPRHMYSIIDGVVYDNSTEASLTANVTSEVVEDSEDQVTYITGATVNGATSYVAVVPSEVKVYVNAPDEGSSSLINIIPLLILAGITIGLVGTFISRRE